MMEDTVDLQRTRKITCQELCTMPRQDLKNKPLVEAILELRWALSTTEIPGAAEDPNYRLLLGRFSERVQKEYPIQ